MSARSTRILRRTAAVSAALTLAGAPAALARPADQGLQPAAPTAASQPQTIVGHHEPDALSMQNAPSQPQTIVGDREPDALSMQNVPSAAPQSSNDGGIDSTWIIVAAGVVALGVAGGLGLAKQRGAIHLSRGHHAGA